MCEHGASVFSFLNWALTTVSQVLEHLVESASVACGSVPSSKAAGYVPGAPSALYLAFLFFKF